MTDYFQRADIVLNETKNRSTQIALEARYDGIGGDVLGGEDDISQTKDSFKSRPGEKILLKTDKIRWVENNSLGTLTLTDQRLFYSPQFYDAPMTTKNLEIKLDSINKVGMIKLGAISAVVIMAGDKNYRIEFTSRIPLKLLKFWRALRGVNKNWKILRS